MNRDAEIFAEAIELPPAERGPFLEAACAGDAELRQRVDLLLAGYEAAGLFMEQSPIERPALPPEERIGARIGRYSLVRKLGEGGCGVVYLADQHEPVRRQVALKIIKLGMDTRSVIARFEAERQALALMDHPDIARVFDAGATDSGRPYFAMEFVDGVPITKFCDEQSLGLSARLELFSRVCVALQHAHQKGIIHRDIKPSNILVTLRDGEPAPKVIDFGIAKATQGRLTEETLLTGFDQFIGTPAYMSPEQAELRDFDIDTRSDIYSLGVLLYELLTGRAPYDTKSLVRAGVDEIRRIIREVDPPRPSTRVGTLADADLATVARLRKAPPARLRGSIRGDLDWIVMRCLEKDRSRRYGAAVELAEDVRRHLRNEPILARRPGALYIARKFVARHRLACASAAAVAAALILGTIVSTRQAIRATRAERIAQAESEEAKRQREQAEALLTFMLGNFRQELEKLGKLELLDSVGVQALAYIASLDPEKLSDVALTRQAKALTQIGDVRLKQARFAEARESFNTAYARAAALAARHPQNGDMLFERAQAEYWIGYAALRQGNLPLASEWLTRYRDSAAHLVTLEGKTPRAQRELISGQHNLATLDYQRRNLDAAERGFREELVAIRELLAADPDSTSLQHRLADVTSWLGWTAETQGRFSEAIEHYREMGARLRDLRTREPAVARWKDRLADSHIFLAHCLAITGRRTEASAQFEQAQVLLDELSANDPANKPWLRTALNTRLNRASLSLARNDHAAAGPFISEAREKLETLFAAEPTDRATASRLASAWTLEARLRYATGNGDALGAAQRAIELGDSFIASDRNDNWMLWDTTQASLLAARVEASRNQPEAARRHRERVIAILAAEVASRPREWRVIDPLAQAYILTGQPALAQPLQQRLRESGYQPVDPLAASTLDLPRQ